MLSRLAITFLPRSKCLLISWLQSPSAVILEPTKIKSATVSTVSPFICHEVKRHLLLRRKVMTNLGSILKSRDITLPTKVRLVKAIGFSNSHVWMWELDYKECWVLKNWCIWTVLEKTLESPLACKEIQPAQPKGNQSWIFTGRTDAEAETSKTLDVKNWLIGKEPDARKNCRWEEKGATEDEMVRWHHRLNGREFE